MADFLRDSVHTFGNVQFPFYYFVDRGKGLLEKVKAGALCSSVSLSIENCFDSIEIFDYFRTAEACGKGIGKRALAGPKFCPEFLGAIHSGNLKELERCAKRYMLPFDLLKDLHTKTEWLVIAFAIPGWETNPEVAPYTKEPSVPIPGYGVLLSFLKKQSEVPEHFMLRMTK